MTLIVGEALNRRADLQKRIAQLQERRGQAQTEPEPTAPSAQQTHSAQPTPRIEHHQTLTCR